jgi:hypothetical protein
MRGQGIPKPRELRDSTLAVDAGIERIRAHLMRRRNSMVVNRHRLVAENESGVGALKLLVFGDALAFRLLFCLGGGYVGTRPKKP